MLTLDPKQIEFNWPNARALAELSAAAYSLGPWDSSLPTPVIIQDSHTQACAIVQDRGDSIVIAFRGSQSAEDYLQDAKFEMEDLLWSNGGRTARCHKGFLEDFDAINQQLIQTIKSISKNRGGIREYMYITGHSLGGALAILCALEYARQSFPVAGVYTFGQPRVGNAAFTEIYDAELADITFRVVNENDIVPRMPPWIAGYRHAGQNIFLPAGTNGAAVKNPSRAYIALSDAFGFWGAFKNQHDVLVSDHFISAYQKRIQLL